MGENTGSGSLMGFLTGGPGDSLPWLGASERVSGTPASLATPAGLLSTAQTTVLLAVLALGLVAIAMIGPHRSGRRWQNRICAGRRTPSPGP
ncbi:MAG: hypothetical protein R3E96_00440 [Planctomycetota bacterium]